MPSFAQKSKPPPPLAPKPPKSFYADRAALRKSVRKSSRRSQKHGNQQPQNNVNEDISEDDLPPPPPPPLPGDDDEEEFASLPPKSRVDNSRISATQALDPLDAPPPSSARPNNLLLHALNWQRQADEEDLKRPPPKAVHVHEMTLHCESDEQKDSSLGRKKGRLPMPSFMRWAFSEDPVYGGPASPTSEQSDKAESKHSDKASSEYRDKVESLDDEDSEDMREPETRTTQEERPRSARMHSFFLMKARGQVPTPSVRRSSPVPEDGDDEDYNDEEPMKHPTQKLQADVPNFLLPSWLEVVPEQLPALDDQSITQKEKSEQDNHSTDERDEEKWSKGCCCCS